MRNLFTTTFWIWSLTWILLSKEFDPNVYKFLSCIRWRDARLNFLTRPSRASSRGSSKKSASKLTKSPHSNKTRLLQLSVLWAPEKFLIYQGFRLNTVMIVFSLDTDMYLKFELYRVYEHEFLNEPQIQTSYSPFGLFCEMSNWLHTYFATFQMSHLCKVFNVSGS